jgi:D-galactarolactone cycloisomerase
VIRIDCIETFVYRYPLAAPVQTSFGTMLDRPMLIVRLRDTDGVEGYGEVWCNFPAIAAEYRAGLIDCVIGPLFLGSVFETPAQMFDQLQKMTHILAIQAGEIGPFSSCLAGIDVAMHDLAARKAGLPLYKILGGTNAIVPVYASGIGADRPEREVDRLQSEGYDAFKLKIGFDATKDLANIKRLRTLLSGGEPLAVDANQAWSLVGAISAMREFDGIDLAWVEEPLAADCSEDDWMALTVATPHFVAAGENISSVAAFDRVIEQKYLSFIQPDIAKWGGFSGCLPVVKRAIAAGLRYFPHYLGGGVGLVASAHLLAAAGGDGRLEVDANPNPLRTETIEDLLEKPRLGLCLRDSPGLGITPNLKELAKYNVHHGAQHFNRAKAPFTESATKPSSVCDQSGEGSAPADIRSTHHKAKVRGE